MKFSKKECWSVLGLLAVMPATAFAETRISRDAAGVEHEFISVSRDYPELGDAWQDEAGNIWGSLVRNEDGSLNTMTLDQAKSYCASVLATVPTVRQLAGLAQQMGADGIVDPTSGWKDGYCEIPKNDDSGERVLDFVYGSGKYSPQALPDLKGEVFWTSSSYSGSGNTTFTHWFQATTGDFLLESGEDSKLPVRCVIDPSAVPPEPKMNWTLSCRPKEGQGVGFSFGVIRIEGGMPGPWGQINQLLYVMSNSSPAMIPLTNEQVKDQAGKVTISASGDVGNGTGTIEVEAIWSDPAQEVTSSASVDMNVVTETHGEISTHGKKVFECRRGEPSWND